MRVSKAVSSLFVNFCFLTLSLIWSYGFFLLIRTRKGTNMLNAPPNLRKFHRRKRSKVLYFLRPKTLRHKIEFRQDRYLSIRKPSNRAARARAHVCMILTHYLDISCVICDISSLGNLVMTCYVNILFILVKRYMLNIRTLFQLYVYMIDTASIFS